MKVLFWRFSGVMTGVTMCFENDGLVIPDAINLKNKLTKPEWIRIWESFRGETSRPLMQAYKFIQGMELGRRKVWMVLGTKVAIPRSKYITDQNVAGNINYECLELLDSNMIKNRLEAWKNVDDRSIRENSRYLTEKVILRKILNEIRENPDLIVKTGAKYMSEQATWDRIGLVLALKKNLIKV